MSRTVNVHEAKTHFSRLLELAHQGEEIIVAKAGKPMRAASPWQSLPPCADRGGWQAASTTPFSSSCPTRCSTPGSRVDASAAGYTRDALAGWPIDHRDPFDRMLAAQSELERMPLITRDAAFALFGVETLW